MRQAPSLNVLYDFQVFADQEFGGVSRYFYELIKSSHPGFSPEIAVRYHQNHYLQTDIPSRSRNTRYPSIINSRFFPGKKQILHAYDAFEFRRHRREIEENKKCVAEKIRQIRPDIFHPTYYDGYFLEYLGKIPFVLTIYDMIHELFPEYFLGDIKTPALKKQLYKAAKHVVAISEATKKDIMRIYGVSGDKISVIHLANSLVPKKKGDSGSNVPLPDRYLLYVGHRGRYKNFWFFLSNIADILKEDVGLHVVCTGVGFNPVEARYIDFLDLSSKVHHVSADENILSGLYAHARALIYPSQYEGFGIPVLEAFSCGCPVILSRCSSLPEVAGKAAEYFDPRSIDEIRKAVKKVVYDDHACSTLVKKGKERLKLFSWEKTVDETFHIYEACL